MRALLDECLSPLIAAALRERGHDVVAVGSIMSEHPGGLISSERWVGPLS